MEQLIIEEVLKGLIRGTRKAINRYFDDLERSLFGQMASLEEAFSVLGLSPDATYEEAKRRYRDLVKQFRNDEAMMRKLIMAWNTLREVKGWL